MSEGRTRRLAAVWFADIVGYTALSNANEDAALEVVDEFQRLVREAVGEKGRVVKFLGDGALSVFDSAQRAIESAVRLRDAFAESRVARAHGCTLSVGVHMGEVVAAEDGDVYGEGVNIASRIEGVATSGQVLISDDVYRLIRNRPGFHAHSVGEHALKGVATPMRLHVIARPGEVAAAAPPKPRATAGSRRAIAVGGLAGVAGFVLLSVFVASIGDEPPVTPGGARAPSPVPEQAATAPRDDAAPPTDAPPATTIRTPTPATTNGRATNGPATNGSTTNGAAPAARTGDDLAIAVLVLGDGPGVQLVEQAVVRAFGPRSGVRAAGGTALGLVRRNPDAVRAAVQGDTEPLVELARAAGMEYVLLGRLETRAARESGRGFTGSADLALRLFSVTSGSAVQSGMFDVGGGSGPTPTAPTEVGARTEAAQAVGRIGATAARAWLGRAER